MGSTGSPNARLAVASNFWNCTKGKETTYAGETIWTKTIQSRDESFLATNVNALQC